MIYNISRLSHPSKTEVFRERAIMAMIFLPIMLPYFAICSLLRWLGWLPDRRWAKVKWEFWDFMREAVWEIGAMLATLGVLGFIVASYMGGGWEVGLLAIPSLISMGLLFYHKKVDELASAAYSRWKALEEGSSK